MEERKIKRYLKYPVKKQVLSGSDKDVVSNYFSELSRRRWAKDTRTKEERSEYYRNLVNKRWKKVKE